MTSARDQAHDVMERAWQEAQREGRWQSYDDTIYGLLDALLAATQEQTCPTCGGTGQIERDEDIDTILDPYRDCPDCTDGVVPGAEPLVLLGPEQIGTADFKDHLVSLDEPWLGLPASGLRLPHAVYRPQEPLR